MLQDDQYNVAVLIWTKNEFQAPGLRRLLCNSLIQSHFDNAFVSWYLLVSQKMRKKIAVAQNRCIHFYFNLNSEQNIRARELKEINWLPTKERVQQRVAIKVFKCL